MTRAEAEAVARERLAFLADAYEEHGNADWNALAKAARRVLDGDRTVASVFRRVFEEPGFAVSASGMEIGHAALGIALCGDREGLVYFATRHMPFNGIEEALDAARVLLG